MIRSAFRHLNRPDLLHLAVVVALVVAIVFVGYRSDRDQKQVVEREVRRQLTEVADMKATQISAWMSERIGDATVAVTDIGLMLSKVQRVLSGQANPATRGTVLAWMEAMRANYQYENVVLTDSNGKVCLSSGNLLGNAEFYESQSKAIPDDSTAGLREVGMEATDARPHFILGVRIANPGGQRIATLLLGIDPQDVFYPTILKWSNSSKSGETIVIRRAGEHVLYLSDLRGKPDSRFRFRSSLADTNLAATQAAFGKEGYLEGADDKGVSILAASRRVPGSEWIVLARIDKDEAYEPVKAHRILVFLFGGVLILLSLAGVKLIWRDRVSATTRERRAQEQEREALLAHYDHLTRNASDAILLVDEAGSIVEANDRATAILGFSKDKLLKMNLRDLKEPSPLGKLKETWDSLQTDGRLIYQNTKRDSGVLMSEVSARTIEIEGTNYCQVIIRDITEQIRAEDQIRRLNRLYAVLSRCGQAVVRAHSEAELFTQVCRIAAEEGSFPLALITRVDAALQQAFPIARAGKSEMYVDELTIMIADVPLGRGPAGTCIREGRPIVIDDFANDPSIGVWKDAATRYGLRSSISIPLRCGGEICGHLGLYASDAGFFDGKEAALACEIGESVSHALDTMQQERKRRLAEQQLRLNRTRLEMILDASDEGYWDWDLVTQEIERSPRYATMLGFEPGELEPSYAAWRSSLHPDEVLATESFFQNFLASGRDAFSREFQIQCKTGGYISVLSRGKIVERDGNGKAIRIAGTMTDITERKKLQDQFLQAQKLESVGRLAGGIAHDFNNLLTVINGFSKLLMGRLPPDSPHLRQLGGILEAGQQAAALTGQLLVFSRKQDTQRQLIRINESIARARELFGPIVGEHIEIKTVFGTLDDAVMADPGQLQQVLMNLMLNARDAMPNGGKLTLETSLAVIEPGGIGEDEDSPGGSYVLLRVSDNGSGMDKATRRQIFEPFFTTKETGKGTGLGLSTVFGIVRQAGGFIRVESELGRGSSFLVYLPLSTQVPAQHWADSALRPGEADSSDKAGSETILVVEDRENVRVLAVETLVESGYEVLAAVNSTDALKIAEARTEPIHLLLTDIVMPGLNGKRLAQRVKLLRPETRVLYMSGYADQILGPAGIADEGGIFIQKPFSPDELTAKVRQVLDLSL